MNNDSDGVEIRRATIARALRLRQMMNQAIRNLSPQERDRRMQVFLAQARGPRQNAELLRMLTNTMVRMRACQRERRMGDDVVDRRDEAGI